MQTQNNNLIQEIGLIVISVAIVAGAVALLILGKIDYGQLVGMIGIAGALWGFNGALKAPSPSQQNQLNAQQANLQQLVSYALSMFPQLVQSLQASVAAPQPQQTAVQPAVQSQAPAPVASPDVAVSPGAQSQAPQFKAPQEHPPIEPGMMVNTLPNIPAFGQSQK